MKILIGIQARSGSTRLPRKAFEMISGRMMLDRVIEACKSGAAGIEKSGNRCSVAVLTPEGDPIATEFSSRAEVIQGPELDVLKRYAIAVKAHDPAYLIRVTGDCPLIPAPLITYLAGIAINGKFDYYSNCDGRYRTSVDGTDCEIVSRDLFDHIAQVADTAYDREHVTTLIRRDPPEWAKLGFAMNFLDFSGRKLSVDTQEDLERVRREFDATFSKYQEAVKFYGSAGVRRL